MIMLREAKAQGAAEKESLRSWNSVGSINWATSRYGLRTLKRVARYNCELCRRGSDQNCDLWGRCHTDITEDDTLRANRRLHWGMILVDYPICWGDQSNTAGDIKNPHRWRKWNSLPDLRDKTLAGELDNLWWSKPCWEYFYWKFLFWELTVGD